MKMRKRRRSSRRRRRRRRVEHIPRKSSNSVFSVVSERLVTMEGGSYLQAFRIVEGLHMVRSYHLRYLGIYVG